jgi:flavin reductase (DIM6/NTAB) family NADH-FMN oxidoreductase RutF
VAWLECKVIPEPHNQNTYDLFIAEVVAAYADERVFSDGRWHFEGDDQETYDKLRTIHHVAGGSFFATGEVHQAGHSG